MVEICVGVHQSLSPIQICLYGRHVFMGYLYDKEKTIGYLSNNNTETLDTWIDSHGWLHSGDIGKIEVSIIAVVNNSISTFDALTV